MSLDLIGLSDVVQVAEHKVSITAASGEEAYLVRRVIAGRSDVVALVLLQWGGRCLFEVYLAESLVRKLVLFQQLVFAHHKQVLVVDRYHDLGALVNLSVSDLDHLFWQRLLNIRVQGLRLDFGNWDYEGGERGV